MQAPTAEVQAILEVNSELDEGNVHRFHIHLPIITHCNLLIIVLNWYSGTLLIGHSSTANANSITDNSESPNCPSIHFNT